MSVKESRSALPDICFRPVIKNGRRFLERYHLVNRSDYFRILWADGYPARRAYKSGGAEPHGPEPLMSGKWQHYRLMRSYFLNRGR